MRGQKRKLFTLGVTGGIGSGKSLVCSMLAEMGARVIHADVEARRLMQEDYAVKREITEAFGKESYHEDGTLNRAYLAKSVFGDEVQVARINGIVHPRMARVFYDAKEKALADGIPLLVYEAALLYESGSAGRLDAVAVVHAPAEQRVERVIKRDGVTEEQVKDRMRHQLSPEELLKRADFVIANDGSVASLENQVRRLYAEISG